jgi:hypothetical protein
MSPPKIPKIQRQKNKLPDPENWMTPKIKENQNTNPKEIKTKAQRKLNLG